MLTPFRYFHEVARLGSIRRASELLNVSPSSISRQMLVLERQFGTVLLIRSAQGVEQTHAGKMVETFIRTMLLDYETLRADIESGLAGNAAPLRRSAALGNRVLHRDVGMAALSALAAVLAIALCSWFWIATGWPSGSVAAMMAAVFFTYKAPEGSQKTFCISTTRIAVRCGFTAHLTNGLFMLRLL